MAGWRRPITNGPPATVHCRVGDWGGGQPIATGNPIRQVHQRRLPTETDGSVSDAALRLMWIKVPGPFDWFTDGWLRGFNP